MKCGAGSLRCAVTFSFPSFKKQWFASLVTKYMKTQRNMTVQNCHAWEVNQAVGTTKLDLLK